MAASDFGVTAEQFIEIQRQARLELSRRYAKRKDVLSWGRCLFPDKFPLPFCRPLHQYLVDTRGEEMTDTEAPRNHAKTAIKCFLVPIFQSLEEPETFRHYLNVQATLPKALSVNMAIRAELEQNDDVVALYGPQIGERWTDAQFVTSKGVVFTAIGAGQSIRGLNYRNVRPDYLVVDDLYDEEDINNPEATEKKNAWFWGSLYPARAKGRRTSVHVQGTAINGEDLLEKLKKTPGVKSATFKAVTDWDKKTVLWPELNTFESLEHDRSIMGSVIFYREMQNERRDETTSIVKRGWLYPAGRQSWEYDPNELRRKVTEKDAKVRVVAVRLTSDPSIGKKAENDFTGTALILETRWTDGQGSEFWIEAIWNEKHSMNDRLIGLSRIAQGRPEWAKVTEVPIEAIAGFNDYADEVIRRTNLPVRRITQVPDKITNLENKSHFFENGKVHLNMNIEQSLKDMLVYQLTSNHPKHDDVRDAVLLGIPNVNRAPGIITL